MNDELNQKLMLLQYLLRKLQLRERMDGGVMANTSNGQGRILALLKMRDGVSMKDLSFMLGLAPSSTSEMLSKLEKNGYITREQNESDKRATIIHLTEKGKNVEQSESATDMDNIFSCFNTSEQKTFGEYLNRLIEVLKERLGYDDEETDVRMQELMQHINGDQHGNSDFDRQRDWYLRFGFGFDRRRGGEERFNDSRKRNENDRRRGKGDKNDRK
jgi:DNA-binding MarR family transcriptional regulator